MSLRATRGYAILRIRPNPEGVIVRPDRWKRDGDVGLVVDDNTGCGLKKDAPVLVSHRYGKGRYFDHDGARYLRIDRDGLLMTTEGSWT